VNKRTYPRTVYFPENRRVVVLNIMPGPGAKFSAVLEDDGDEGRLIWGIGDTEMAAIADLAASIEEGVQ
jgi:hypothetical protein